MVGDFAASGAVLFFGGRLGVAVWLQPIRPWVIVAFILSGAILLTHAVTFLAQRLRGRTRMGKIHFVPDAYNNGWSKQHETEMNVRVGGTFTFTGPGDVKVLRASLRGTGLSPDLMAQVPAPNGSGRMVAMNVLWLREGEVLQAFFDLRLAPVLGTPGKELRRGLFFHDNLKRKFSLGKVVFPYIGRK